MRQLRALKSAVPLLLLFQAGSPAEPVPASVAGTASPAVRACVVHDFGEPKTLVPVTSEDAIWNQEPGRLAEAPGGMIYSTSPSGGKYGRGTIWRYDPLNGKLEVVHHFKDTTGAGPRSGLIAGRKADGSPDGYLYGTTYGGGKWGVGTVFRIAPGASTPEVLYSFRNGNLTGIKPANCPPRLACSYTPRQRADGAASYPVSAPVITADGAIYGVSSYSNNQGFGVLYKLGGGDDGLTAVCLFDYRLLANRDMKEFVCHPRVWGAWTLALGNDGRTMFGTTVGGYGSIWSSTGSGIQVLHEFKLTDGSKPENIMQASNGNLFGTTWAGGEVGAGTVFRYSTVNSGFETLSHFNTDYTLGSFAPGLNPIGGLVERLDTLDNNPENTVRSLYGSAKFGGKGGRGTIYRIGLDGSGFKVVQHLPWSWGALGRSPLGALLLHSTGAIYATTYQGGNTDGGALLRLTGFGLPDIPDLSVVPKYTAGTIAKDAAGKPLTDNLLTVRVGVCSYQALDASNKPKCVNGDPDGIKFEAALCRNPHYVQFIYREEIVTGSSPLQRRSGTAPLGYPLTMNPSAPDWDVDVGRSTSADAYWDDVPGNPVIRGAFNLINADAPSMVSFGTGAAGTDTRRAVFRTYLYCNCQLQRLVKWTREQIGTSPAAYIEMSLEKTTAADQAFIDGLLKAQKFVPVP